MLSQANGNKPGKETHAKLAYMNKEKDKLVRPKTETATFVEKPDITGVQLPAKKQVKRKDWSC